MIVEHNCSEKSANFIRYLNQTNDPRKNKHYKLFNGYKIGLTCYRKRSHPKEFTMNEYDYRFI